MLKGISPVISPDLLYTLHVMGHGDEIVLADAHFPTESLNDNILRADGVKIQDLLMGILPLFNAWRGGFLYVNYIFYFKITGI